MTEITIEKMAEAMEIAMRKVLSDPEVRADYWKAGWEELSKHATDAGTQWVGRRIVSAIGGALLAFSLWLGFKFGGWGH